MMRKTLWVGLVLGSTTLVMGCATNQGDLARAGSYNDSATGFVDKVVLVDGEPKRYALYVPYGYTPEKAWPLVVFLHGAGERGDDNLLQTEVGIGRAIRLHRDWFPALVLMPQCPEGRFWDAAIPTIESAMAQTRAQYHVDDRAISLTGLSLGGFATWIWGATKTDTFAALMPVCGGGDPELLGNRVSEENRNAFGTMDERVQKLAAVPIWAFHGAYDTAVPPDRSRNMVQRIREAGGDIQYTEFEETGHNSWDKTYGNKQFVDWLLEQRKP